MAAKITEVSGVKMDVTRYVGLLEFYSKDDLIEMLEDIAFAYAVHHIENAEEISLMGAAARLDLLKQLIGTIREVQPVE